MYKLVIEKGTLEYTRFIQGAQKGRSRKKHTKNTQNTQEDDPTYSINSNKGIEPSLIYMLTEAERIHGNESFNF